MKRKHKEVETVKKISPTGHMSDIMWYLRNMELGINPHAPSVLKIRKAIAKLGEMPRMMMKNHCLLLKGDRNWKPTDEERKLVDNLLEVLE